jgi:hypothetical protein
MKITRQSLLAASTLAIGGFIGASILVAFADSTWTSAPNCSGTTMPCSNVAAPINVSAAPQGKLGALAIGSTNPTTGVNLDVSNGTGLFNSIGVTGSLLVSSGASTTAGAILTNTGNGIATWSKSDSAGSGYSFGGMYDKAGILSYPNVYTGGYNCPTGYTSTLVSYFTDKNSTTHSVYYCYK